MVSRWWITCFSYSFVCLFTASHPMSVLCVVPLSRTHDNDIHFFFFPCFFFRLLFGGSNSMGTPLRAATLFRTQRATLPLCPHTTLPQATPRHTATTHRMSHRTVPTHTHRSGRGAVELTVDNMDTLPHRRLEQPQHRRRRHLLNSHRQHRTILHTMPPHPSLARLLRPRPLPSPVPNRLRLCSGHPDKDNKDKDSNRPARRRHSLRVHPRPPSLRPPPLHSRRNLSSSRRRLQPEEQSQQHHLYLQARHPCRTKLPHRPSANLLKPRVRYKRCRRMRRVVCMAAVRRVVLEHMVVVGREIQKQRDREQAVRWLTIHKF
eukprot:m.114503 g.114503  ORF g.114503 m.114503 type:complete len:319 (-) comp10844_c0_seq4:17-973(-)